MNTLQNVRDFYNAKNYSNLTQKAYDMLLEMILSQILEPEHIYSEGELSQALQIGRTPVREALQRLQFDMLVEVIPRSGIRIAPMRLEDYYLQIEVRRLLEKLIIMRSAKFSTPQERAQLIALAQEYQQATRDKNEVDVLRVDAEFHALVADSARNPFAKRALQPFQILEQRLFYLQYDVEPQVVDQINQCHLRLMHQIAGGDGEAACATLDEMLGHTEQLVRLRSHGWEQLRG